MKWTIAGVTEQRAKAFVNHILQEVEPLDWNSQVAVNAAYENVPSLLHTLPRNEEGFLFGFLAELVVLDLNAEDEWPRDASERARLSREGEHQACVSPAATPRGKRQSLREMQESSNPSFVRWRPRES